MLRMIARSRPSLLACLQELVRTMPDGNPRAQEKLRRKLKEVGGLLIPDVYLTPGKRGRYKLHIVSIDSWDAERKDFIQDENDAIPDKPWLACSIAKMESSGNYSYSQSRALVLLVTHHALSRLAQRYRATTARDLLIAVDNILYAFMDQHHKNKNVDWIRDGMRMQFPLTDTENAAAVINRYDEDGLRTKGVVVTIV